MKPIRLSYCERRKDEISRKIGQASPGEKEKLGAMLSKLQKEITRIKKTAADDLFDDPEFMKGQEIETKKSFEYQMKSEIERGSKK